MRIKHAISLFADAVNQPITTQAQVYAIWFMAQREGITIPEDIRQAMERKLEELT